MRSIQHEDGYWWAELESNATMAAEHVMLEHVLGIAEPLRMRKLARYILGLQQDDGSWPIYFGGPGDVSITTEAYFALKLAGTPADAPEMARARAFVLAHGGAGATRIFTKHLAGAVRSVRLGRAAGDAAGSDPAAGSIPDQHL